MIVSFEQSISIGCRHLVVEYPSLSYDDNLEPNQRVCNLYIYIYEVQAPITCLGQQQAGHVCRRQPHDDDDDADPLYRTVLIMM